MTSKRFRDFLKEEESRDTRRFEQDESEREFRHYGLDEESEFDSKLEAKNIIRAFIKTENEAEEIKSRTNNKKPSYWKQSKDPSQDYTSKLDKDMELAL